MRAPATCSPAELVWNDPKYCVAADMRLRMLLDWRGAGPVEIVVRVLMIAANHLEIKIRHEDLDLGGAGTVDIEAGGSG
jgi:hypothetical protein